MNSSKQFITSLITLGLFLIFVPNPCRADMAVGAITFLFVFPPTLFLLIFFVVWAVESLVIQRRLEENPKKTLKVSALINLLSTILGYLTFRFLNNGLFYTLFESFFSFVIFLFIGTFVVEGMILFLIYSNAGARKVLVTTFIMNFFSYLLLFGIFWIGAVPLFGTIISFTIIFYLVLCLFGLFKTTQVLPAGEEISTEAGSGIKYFVYAILIILFFVALFIDLQPSHTRDRARDARIQGDLAQARSIAEMILSDEGNYDSLCDNFHTLNKEDLNYGSQLKILEDDMIAQLQGTKKKGIKPACFASGSNYCISAAINGSRNYICADAINFVSEIPKPCNSADKCPAK